MSNTEDFTGSGIKIAKETLAERSGNETPVKLADAWWRLDSVVSAIGPLQVQADHTLARDDVVIQTESMQPAYKHA